MNKKNTSPKGNRTAKENRAMLIFNVLLVVALVSIFVVPRMLYNSRNHIVGTDAAGRVTGLQDNWVVIDLEDRGTKKYSHLADAEPAEGYRLRGTGYLTDENVRMIYFETDGELGEYTVMATHGAYDRRAEEFRGNQEMLLTEVLNLGAVETGQSGKWRTASFCVNGTIDDMYDAEGNAITPTEDAEGNPVYPQKYEQAVYLYLESPMSDTSVLLSMTLFNREENVFPAMEEMTALLQRAAEGIRYQ